jgi:hypothetical protein
VRLSKLCFLDESGWVSTLELLDEEEHVVV